MMPAMMAMIFCGVLAGFILGVIVTAVYLAPDGNDKK